jgi:hypothetical protein
MGENYPVSGDTRRQALDRIRSRTAAAVQGGSRQSGGMFFGASRRLTWVWRSSPRIPAGLKQLSGR